MKCPFELPVVKVYSKILCCFRVQDKAGHVIGELSSSEDEADYIVQVINSHDALLEVLKDIQKRIEESEMWWMDNPDRGGFDTVIIDQAIAQAEK